MNKSLVTIKNRYFRTIIKFVSIIIIVVINASIINSCGSKDDSVEDIYKKESEQKRKQSQDRDNRKAFVDKYKYLEKRKLRGKKSADSFVAEIEGLGFAKTEEKRNPARINSLGGKETGSDEFRFEKTESNYTIILTVVIYDDGDYFIVVE